MEDKGTHLKKKKKTHHSYFYLSYHKSFLEQGEHRKGDNKERKRHIIYVNSGGGVKDLS